MLSKIFIKNFSAHKNNYIVYIASSASAVMVYFILFFLIKNPMLNHEITNWKEIYGKITDLLNTTLIVLEWVFVAYVSGMFIKERKKEFGLYRFLGVSKYRIATGIFVETFFIQAISWLIGFVLAIVLSKLFGMILIKAMNVDFDYTFFINMPILRTVSSHFLTFTIILGLINFFRVLRLKDKPKSSRNWRVFRYIIGIIGAVMVVAGCYQAVRYNGVLSNASYGLFAADQYAVSEQNAFGIIEIQIFLEIAAGTYFLYVGFLEVLIHGLGRSAVIKYNGLKNITSKLFDRSLRKNASSLWIITIMSGLSILMFFVAVILLQSTKYSDDSTYPYDAAVSQKVIKETKQVLAANNSHIKKDRAIKVKQMLGSSHKLEQYGDNIISVISYNDYEKSITAEQKKYNDDIKPDELMLLSDSGGLVLDVPQKKSSFTVTLTVKKQKLRVTHRGKSIPISPRLYYGDVLVVPQKMYDQLPGRYEVILHGLNYTHAYSASLNKKLDELAKNKKMEGQHAAIKTADDDSASILKMDAKGVANYAVENTENVSLPEKATYKVSFTSSENNRQTRGFVIFLISILSVIFVVALESILSIKQFSENIRNRKMYRTIKDLGIGQDNIDKLVFRQTALLFYLPMTLAIVYAVFGANYFITISTNSYWYMFAVILMLYTIFYTILFFITAGISKAQVNKMIN